MCAPCSGAEQDEGVYMRMEVEILQLYRIKMKTSGKTGILRIGIYESSVYIVSIRTKEANFSGRVAAARWPDRGV